MDLLLHIANHAAKNVLAEQRYDRIRSKTNQLQKAGKLKEAPKTARRSGKMPQKTFISGLEAHVKRTAEAAFGVKFVKTRNLPFLRSPMTGKMLATPLNCVWRSKHKVCSTGSSILTFTAREQTTMSN